MSKINKKISVITVTYNCVDLIEATLLSVLNQKLNLVEHIVIDGCSTDGTINVLEKYRDNLAYFVSEPDSGIYDAMNKGISVAKGEWILFLNAGDIFYETLSLSEFTWSWPAEKEFIFFAYMIEGQFNEITPDLKIKFGMPTSHQAMLVASTVLKKIRFNSCFRVAADYDFFLRRSMINETCGYVDSGILTKVLPGGFSKINLDLMKKEYMKIIYQNFGLKKALIYYICSNKFLFAFLKKLMPTSLFQKLKNTV